MSQEYKDATEVAKAIDLLIQAYFQECLSTYSGNRPLSSEDQFHDLVQALQKAL